MAAKATADPDKDVIVIPNVAIQIANTLANDPRYLVIEGKEVLFCSKVFKMLQQLNKEEWLHIPPSFTLEQAICTVAATPFATPSACSSSRAACRRARFPPATACVDVSPFVNWWDAVCAVFILNDKKCIEL